MLTHGIWRVAAGIVLASSLCATLAQGQTAPAAPQTTSLGDAGRKAREQNKGRQPAKVFTNEDMGDLKGTVSVVGTAPVEPVAAPATPPATPATPPAGAATAPVAVAPATPAAPAKDEAYWRAQFTTARKKLADDSKEADILQREYNLKQQQFYTNPNVALREQTSRADLNKTLEQINTKKTDVEKDQQAITTLEDQLRQAGGNPGWSRAQ